MSGTRVLLTTLSVRNSARGRPHLSGFLSKSRVVAFEGEADRFGNPTWDIFVAEPEPRDGAPAARQRASGAGAGYASPDILPPARAPVLAAPAGCRSPRAPAPGRSTSLARCCATKATRT